MRKMLDVMHEFIEFIGNKLVYVHCLEKYRVVLSFKGVVHG